jgi:CheY-like chemotaxis protein/HPt (histidine-containing phosphotransfer) domain-containing protein
MTSVNQRGHGTLARESGVAAYLTKPVRQSQLFESLALVMSNPGGDALSGCGTGAPEVVTRHTIDERERRTHLRILIAEDHVVNQQLAKLQVEKLGYRADVVANGLEAIEALRLVPYSLILMDCQMPEMDGFEATTKIRQLKNDLRTQQLPIIAMTANAMKGDREKCIAVGMDDFVSKPVKQEELAAVLRRWTNKKDTTLAASPVKNKINIQMTAHDCSEITQRLNELGTEFGTEIINRLLDTFLLDTESRLVKLRLLLENKDASGIAREGHALKGSCGNLGATRLAKLCAQLEQHGREHSLGEAQVVVKELAEALRLIQPALNQRFAKTELTV